MTDLWLATIDKWWNKQDKFRTRCISSTGMSDGMWVLKDVQGGFDVNVFDSQADAREFAYQMVHGILHEEDRAKLETVEDLDVRQFLIETAQNCQNMLAQDGLCKRHIDYVGIVLEKCKDALRFEGIFGL